MRTTKILLPALAVVLLAGCAGGSGSGTGSSKDRPDIPVTGAHWSVDTLTVDGGKTTAPVPTAYVEFESGGRAKGNFGCNHFTATATVEGDTITVSEVAMTEMACEEPVRSFEDGFRETFTGRLDARLDGDRLTLTAPDGDTIALTEQPAAPLVGTTWSVDSLLDGETASSLPAGTRGKAHLTIADDGSVRGALGCNSFSGTVKTEGDKLTFGPLAVTRKMCTKPEMELEQQLYGTLSSGPVTFRLQHRALTVTEPDGSGFAAHATSK
ncbi:META domain-containing protein [Streptomyces sp. TRM49041]|uniref:META domain-containing protein n=1 Tax=Streptomyces sp. TRM49041 TaxID=2603216 RepID=UPI0011EC8332|nr:META domain-containing protein [Streptomyces sp. TRM49041]